MAAQVPIYSLPHSIPCSLLYSLPPHPLSLAHSPSLSLLCTLSLTICSLHSLPHCISLSPHLSSLLFCYSLLPLPSLLTSMFYTDQYLQSADACLSFDYRRCYCDIRRLLSVRHLGAPLRHSGLLHLQQPREMRSVLLQRWIHICWTLPIPVHL